MKVEVGKTYKNRGKGTTLRRVIGIGVEYRPSQRYSSEKQDTDAKGILYQQRHIKTATWSAQREMWMDSFESWCGSEVEA